MMRSLRPENANTLKKGGSMYWQRFEEVISLFSSMASTRLEVTETFSGIRSLYPFPAALHDQPVNTSEVQHFLF